MTEQRKRPRVNRAERAYLESQIESLKAEIARRDAYILDLKRARGAPVGDLPAGATGHAHDGDDEEEEEEGEEGEEEEEEEEEGEEGLRGQIEKALQEAEGFRQMIDGYRREWGERPYPGVGKGKQSPPAVPLGKEEIHEVVGKLRDFESEVSAALEDARESGLAAAADPSVVRAAVRFMGSSGAMAGILQRSSSGGGATTDEEAEKEEGGGSKVARRPSSSPSPPPPRGDCAKERKEIKELTKTLAGKREQRRQLEEKSHNLDILSNVLLRRYDALGAHDGATAFEPQSDFTVIDARPTTDGGEADEGLMLKIAKCKKEGDKHKKELEKLREENKRLVDLNEQYRIWYTGLLDEGGNKKFLNDLEESRKECAQLTRSISVRTKELDMLLESELDPDELKKREKERGDYLLQLKELVTEAEGFPSCKDIKGELREVHKAIEGLQKENNFLVAALRAVVPTEGPEGGDDRVKEEIANLNALLAASESRRSNAKPGFGCTTWRLNKELREAVVAAATPGSKRAADLTARGLILQKQIDDAKKATDLTRVASLTEEIAAVEAGIVKEPKAADFAVLSDLRTERLRLSPLPELHEFTKDLLKEATPAIIDLPDSYFKRAWENLFERVQIWCYNYYGARENSYNPTYEELVKSGHLLSFYLRDLLIHRDYVGRLVPGNSSEQGRVDLATGIVFKILVEEVFEPVRFLLHLRFQDPAERWKIKPQYKPAFEAKDMDNEAANPRFQACESFLERKRKKTEDAYPEPEVVESVPYPRKRVKNSQDHFNFFRTFEDDEPPGVGRDNDDDILLNTSRAKLMRTIFSLADNTASHKFKAVRADVSALITDTLWPLALICTPGDQTTETTTTWADDPRTHKQQLWKIIKTAYDLAIEMRTQRTIIHPVCTDLMSMQPFDASAMTITNHPSTVGPRRRQRIDKLYGAMSQRAMPEAGRSGVGCHLRPVCEVLPGLLRRGNPDTGGYSWTHRQVISKARVYVGGPDDETARDGLWYTVHEFPYGLEGPEVASVDVQ